MNGCIGVTLPGRSPKSFDWITPTVRSRPATTRCMQILHTRSMSLSPNSKRKQGSARIGMPEFPGMFPVRAGKAANSPRRSPPPSLDRRRSQEPSSHHAWQSNQDLPSHAWYYVHDAGNPFASHRVLGPRRTCRADPCPSGRRVCIGVNAAGAETRPTESTGGPFFPTRLPS